MFHRVLHANVNDGYDDPNVHRDSECELVNLCIHLGGFGCLLRVSVFGRKLYVVHLLPDLAGANLTVFLVSVQILLRPATLNGQTLNITPMPIQALENKSLMLLQAVEPVTSGKAA